MAARRATGARDRGGAAISAPASTRPRLTPPRLGGPAIGAAALTVGLAAFPAAAVPGTWRYPLAALGAAALALLLGALVARRSWLLPWSIGLLGSSAAVAMLIGVQAVERTVPLYGAGLLLAAELADWAMDRTRLPREPKAVADSRRLLLLTTIPAAAALAALATLAAGLRDAANGLVARVGAAGAAVMVVWIVAALTRRAGRG